MYKSFIDTNIWIYAFTETEKDIEKHSNITHFLEELKSKSNILISVQVLNEFHWTLKRKYKIEETAIREKVQDGILQVCEVIPLDLQCYKKACEIRDKYNVSFWDSLIVAAALSQNCELLYSEDMHHGQKIEDKLIIQNPLIDH
jgi:predicted nucleic acid-binding protein